MKYGVAISKRYVTHTNRNWFMTQRVLNKHKAKSIIQVYSDVMKTIQCAHPLHHHNGFVATYRLWTASGGVHALLVLEPTECSTGTRLGA